MELDASPTTWTVTDVADYLRKERHWVTTRARLPIGDPRRIPNVKDGREYRFSPRLVIEWFEASCRCTSPAPGQVA